jgi:hypothetical protein
MYLLLPTQSFGILIYSQYLLLIRKRLWHLRIIFMYDVARMQIGNKIYKMKICLRTSCGTYQMYSNIMLQVSIICRNQQQFSFTLVNYFIVFKYVYIYIYIYTYIHYSFAHKKCLINIFRNMEHNVNWMWGECLF